MILFFFSSRRRHTRWPRDWSSDVCSSDLSQYQISVLIDGKPKALNIPAELVEKVRQKIEMRRRFDAAAATICKVNLRSEERRVGKECRARLGPEEQKKKVGISAFARRR